MSSSSKPFDTAARHAREALTELGPVASMMEDLAGQAETVANELNAQLRKLGPATSTDTPREMIQREILSNFAQMCQQVYAQFLQVSIVHGTALAHQPVGPQLVTASPGKVVKLQ